MGPSNEFEDRIEDRIQEFTDTSIGSGFSLEIFQSIFDQSPQGVVIFDLLGNFIHCNPAFFVVFGNPEPYSVRNFNLLEENHISKNVLQALRNGQRVRREYEFDYEQLKSILDFRIPLKKKLIFEIDYIPIKDYQGNTQCYVCILDDIEKRRQTQDKLLKAIQMQTSGEFAAGIAHDFNNILSQIIGYLDLVDFDIQDIPNAPNSLKESIETIRSASHRAQSLTSSLLSYSRQGKYNPKCMDMNKIVVEVLNLISKGLKSPIRYEFKIQLTSLNSILADETQIYQVIQNLVLNARDSMKTGGIIEIETDDFSTEGYTGRFEPIPKGIYVRFVVRDHGCGIKDEMISKLFQPFYSTKEKGSGLGLAVVFGILKNHGAYMDIETKVEEGTTFTTLFPVKTMGNVGKEIKTYQKIERVLIVDDEPNLLQILKIYLEKLHFIVLTAKDGTDALKIFKENNIDLVITDLIMEPMDGYDLFHEIRRIKPNQSIWIMSGYYKDEKVQQLLEQGALGFVNKPFSYQDIVKLTKEMSREDFETMN